MVWCDGPFKVIAFPNQHALKTRVFCLLENIKIIKLQNLYHNFTKTSVISRSFIMDMSAAAAAADGRTEADSNIKDAHSATKHIITQAAAHSLYLCVSAVGGGGLIACLFACLLASLLAGMVLVTSSAHHSGRLQTSTR